MGTFYLIGCIISDSLSASFRKPFRGRSITFYSAIISAVSCLVFLVYSKFQLAFDSNVIVHGLLSAVLMTTTNIFLTKALQIGSLSLSSLVMSLSLLIPTFYGILFLGDNPTLYFYFGLIVLVIAIFFLNVEFKKPSAEKQKKKFNYLWLIFISLAFVCNGFSSSIIADFTRKLKMDVESGLISEQSQSLYQSGVMILVFGVSAVISFIISLFKERESIKSEIKPMAFWGTLCGLAVGIVNLFVILAQMTDLNVSLVFTVISGGSMTMTFITALIIFKEKYEKMQYVGFFFGLVSLILLNL